ncbi:Zinc finger C4H2 domain-containing protein [Acropora cervicornis]|uniref:Zinc finger C4H2 domain-containing protein n=1 Tax=Acropora cervicornis TaxID=6130 RepID=A0AAD9R154_ACRCE|nr:Zinc finger C4H2 domain-containing protein [Acropora cervicornis]
MEALLPDKMAHVEELRLIQSDINLIENTINECEAERERGLETLRSNPNSQCFQYKKKHNTFFNCTGFLNFDGSLSHRNLNLLLYPPRLLAAAAAAAAQQLVNKRGPSTAV